MVHYWFADNFTQRTNGYYFFFARSLALALALSCRFSIERFVATHLKDF